MRGFCADFARILRGFSAQTGKKGKIKAKTNENNGLGKTHKRTKKRLCLLGLNN